MNKIFRGFTAILYKEFIVVLRDKLAAVNIQHADIRPIAPSLEDVFVALTANGNSRGEI